MKISTAVLCCGVFVALALATARAQTNFTFSGLCGKADVMQSVPAGDKPGHSFAISRGRCTTNDRIAGESGGEGAWADLEDVTAARLKAHGVYTETFAGGDKIFYGYKQTLKMQNGAPVSGTGEFKIIGGTGKLAAIKAKGKCTFTPAANGTMNYSCTGEYGTASAM